MFLRNSILRQNTLDMNKKLPTILIIDDNAQDLFLTIRAIKFLFKKYDLELEIISFTEIDKALNFILISDKNLIILLDVNMPIMNGAVALQRIKEKTNFRVIMLSTSEEDTENTLQKGADLYLVKANNVPDFVKNCDQIFNKFICC